MAAIYSPIHIDPRYPHIASDTGSLHRTDFGLDVVEEYESEEASSSSEPIAILSTFRALVRHYFESACREKLRLQAEVASSMLNLEGISEKVDILLAEAIASGKPSRLDDAIDVLSDERLDLIYFLSLSGFEDNLEQYDEDAVYILIRAAARQAHGWEDFGIHKALESRTTSLRDAAVEALADRRLPRDIEDLRRIAASDPSISVRHTAQELLSDISED